VQRRRYHCNACGGIFPLDNWGGITAHSLTAGARRLLTLAGTSWSFDRASRHLAEFAKITVCDDVIERVCQEEGERAKGWMERADAPATAFAKAKGQAEFSTDGVKVNTVGGWREMRLSTLAKREPTTPCDAREWDRRVLNQPTVRLSICRIAGSDHVGASWERLSRRMKLQDEPVVNVIADGAKWIWEQAAKRLPKNAEWCVDPFHVSQHLHVCGKALKGEGPGARAWAEETLQIALEHNGPKLIEQMESQAAAAPMESPAQQALEALLTFLRPNRDRMWYRDRLAQGLTIGSGMIEGGCKNTIGARLKLNNARWRVRRAERIGTLRCIDASNQWENFWQEQQAA
jgi:hypothetical protein